MVFMRYFRKFDGQTIPDVARSATAQTLPVQRIGRSRPESASSRWPTERERQRQLPRLRSRYTIARTPRIHAHVERDPAYAGSVSGKPTGRRPSRSEAGAVGPEAVGLPALLAGRPSESLPPG